MKALSLWQPWGSLWLSSRKPHETRHWYTSYRGLLLVHAAKRFEKDFDGGNLPSILRAEFGARWYAELPTGALIGIVELVDCLPTGPIACAPGFVRTDDWECGNWETGRFAWRRAERYLRFDTPIPYRGAQGFFNVPDELIKPNLGRWRELYGASA